MSAGMSHGQNSFDAWPMAAPSPAEPPLSFTRSFGYTLLAQRLRFLAGNIPGITSAKRQALSAIAEGIEAGICDDPDGMRSALATVDLMERCR
jgi:hypothetical protein